VQELYTRPTARGQAHLFTRIDEAWLNDEALPLGELSALVPDEPLTAIKPYDTQIHTPDDLMVTRRGKYKIVQLNWSGEDIALNKWWPGTQLDYRYREAHKYNSPYGEPLGAWVRELLITAKMHHSRALEANANGWPASPDDGGVDSTGLQFLDWLPLYMDMGQQSWFWTFGEGWGDAAQVVRMACGLPRFAATRVGGSQ
jgi:hypothetical protein